jgi:hypothetical protein
VVGKVERRARNPRVTQEMISKMNERNKWNNFSNEGGRKNGRKVRKELKKDTEKAKNEYFERIREEIVEFQKTEGYDVMHLKTDQLGWKENPGIRNIGIENS